MKKILKLVLIGIMVICPGVVHAENLDINLQEANTLMNKISIEENRFGNWFGYYYKRDKVTIDDFSNQMKLYFAARTFNKDKPDEGTNGVDVTVSKEQMYTAMKSIFGPDIKYNDETIKVDPTLLAKGTYDNTKQEYTLSFDHAWGDEFFDGYPTYYVERISQTKDSNKIEVKEKVLYYETFIEDGSDLKKYAKVYRVNPKTLIEKTEENDGKDYMKKYKEYVDTYKYTFKKASDGEYYFYSVENLKDAKEYKSSTTTVKKTSTKETNPKTSDTNLFVLLGIGISMVLIIVFSSRKVLKK